MAEPEDDDSGFGLIKKPSAKTAKSVGDDSGFGLIKNKPAAPAPTVQQTPAAPQSLLDTLWQNTQKFSSGVVGGLGNQVSPLTVGKGLFDTGRLLLDPWYAKNFGEQMGQQAKDIYAEAAEQKNPMVKALKYTYGSIPIAGPMMNEVWKAIDRGDYETVGNLVGQGVGGVVAPEIYGKALVTGLPSQLANLTTKFAKSKTQEFEKLQDVTAAKQAGLQKGAELKTPDVQQQIETASPKAKLTALNLRNAKDAAQAKMYQEAENLPTLDHRMVLKDNPLKGKEAPPDPRDPDYQTKMVQWTKDQMPYDQPDPIKGPVHLDNTMPYAQSLKQTLLDSLAQIPSTNRRVIPTLRDVGALADIPESVGPDGAPLGRHAIEFSRLHGISKGLAEILGTDAPDNLLPQTMNREVLSGLKNSVDSDLKDSMQWWGRDAKKAYKDYTGAVKNQADTLKPTVAQKLIKYGKDPMVQYEAIRDAALENESTAKQFLKVTGDQDSLANLAMKKLGDAFTKDDKLDAKGMLNELNGENSKMYDTAIPKQTLDNLKEFLGTIKDKQLEPVNYPGKMKTLPFLAHSSIPAGIGFALMKMMHGESAATYGGMVSALGLGNAIFYKYADRMMSNPNSARAIINMAKNPGNTAFQQAVMPIVKNALRASEGESIVKPKTPPQEE